MKVILSADVHNLGEDGDIVEVADGFARNYLLPKKFATLYSTGSLAALEARKAQIARKKEEKRQAALGDKAKISGLTLSISMPAGETGKLFGSVSSAMVAEELAHQGIQVERKRIDVPGHFIKQAGDYKVTVKLYGNESAELRLQVVAAKAGSGQSRAPAIAPEVPAAEPAAADGDSEADSEE